MIEGRDVVEDFPYHTVCSRALDFEGRPVPVVACDDRIIVDELEQRNTRLEEEYQTQQQKLLSIENAYHELTQRYTDLVSSLSWKMTKPLRLVKEITARKKS